MPDDELSLQEAAAVFNINSEELHLALEALETERQREAYHAYVEDWDKKLYRRAERRGSTIITVYKRADCEAAVALAAAKLLGFTDTEA